MVEQYNGIDLSQFGEYTKKHMLLLEPCFHFQRVLRSKCLGTRFWKRQLKRRKKKFGDMTWTDIYEVSRTARSEATEFRIDKYASHDTRSSLY